MLVWNKEDIIPSNVSCSRHDIAEKITQLMLNNNHSLYLYISFLTQVPNSAIKDCRNYTDFTGKEFLDPQADKTVKAEDAK